MPHAVDYQRFERLTFDDFRRLAVDASLTPVEKVGFPQSYRAGKEEAIFSDIVAKLPGLSDRGRVVLDIGPGCSDVARRLIAHCDVNRHNLLLVDSAEMLTLLPDPSFVRKYAARYPQCPEVMAEFEGRVDVI